MIFKLWLYSLLPHTFTLSHSHSHSHSLLTHMHTLTHTHTHTLTHTHTHTLTQCVGGVLIGLGVWIEILDQNFEAVVDGDQILYGAYITIAAGCAIIVLGVVGIIGAVYDHLINRVILFVVSLIDNGFAYS